MSRRHLLWTSLLAGVGVVLAACGFGRESAVPSLGASSGAPGSVPPSAPTSRPAPTPSLSTEPSPSPTATRPPLRERIAGLLVVGFRGLTIDDAPWIRDAIIDGGLGGVILFDRDQATGGMRNVRSPRQVTDLVTSIHAATAGRPLVVAIDQEGGVVTRLGPAHGFPEVASEASVGRGTAAAARAWADGLVATLDGVGINLNFAPVVDLDVDPDSPAIGRLDRSFSADPDVVVELATIEIEAHRKAGILTTLKHFPGIGSAATNTDFGVADVTRTWTPVELEPFRRLIAAGTADLVMAGHVVNGQIDPDLPASLSKATVTGLLRDQLGWNGVVVTDDLQAEAIDAAFGRDEAVLLALEAGNDVLLFANQQTYDAGLIEPVIDVVAGAVEAGRLPESRIDEAWDRVQRTIVR